MKIKIKRWWLVGAVVGALIITLILLQEWINNPPTKLLLALIFSALYLFIGIMLGTIVGYLIEKIMSIDKKRSLLIGGIVGTFLIPFIILEILGFIRGETSTLEDHITLLRMNFSLFYNFIFLPLYVMGLLLGTFIGYIIDNGFSAVLKIRKWILGAIIGAICGLLIPFIFFFSLSYQPTTTGAGYQLAILFFLMQIISPILGIILGAILGWVVDNIIKH